MYSPQETRINLPILKYASNGEQMNEGVCFGENKEGHA